MSKDLEQAAREIATELTGGPIGFAYDDVEYEQARKLILQSLCDLREADAQVAEQYSAGFSKEATVYLVSHDIAAAIRQQGVK